MSLLSVYEIIGYIASALVAISLMMSSILKLRVINLIGAAFFTVYGLLIGAYPVAVVNFIIVLIDIVGSLGNNNFVIVILQQLTCQSRSEAYFFLLLNSDVFKLLLGGRFTLVKVFYYYYFLIVGVGWKMENNCAKSQKCDGS